MSAVVGYSLTACSSCCVHWQAAWFSKDPWTLLGKDHYLYGRGVTDDKGPILATIFAIRELIEADELRCNVRFLYEGEEESKSSGFRKAVEAKKTWLGGLCVTQLVTAGFILRQLAHLPVVILFLPLQGPMSFWCRTIIGLTIAARASPMACEGILPFQSPYLALGQFAEIESARSI